MARFAIYGSRTEYSKFGFDVTSIKFHRGGWLHTKEGCYGGYHYYWTKRQYQDSWEYVGYVDDKEIHDLVMSDIPAHFEWTQDRNKTPKIRDSQKTKLYRWEDKYLVPLAKTLTENGVKDLVHELSTIYGVTVKNVHFRKRGATFDNELKLLPQHMNTAIVIHEFAHLYVRQKIKDKKVASHGAAFVSVYLSIAAKYLNFNANTMRDLARKSKLVCDQTF